MSTLYIRLPSSATASDVPRPADMVCRYALAGISGSVETEGIAPLVELKALIARAQRTVLIITASDVTLLRVKTPPLSPSRLRAALPGLVEDQLIADPADCVIAAGDLSDGLRTIAVMQRDWLAGAVSAVSVAGGRHIMALPAQLCLPYEDGVVTAAAIVQDGDVDLTLRLSRQEGIGLPVMPEHADTATGEVLQALRAVVPSAPIRLQVTPSAVTAFQNAGFEGITVVPDNWQDWIAGAAAVRINLMSSFGAGAQPVVNWRTWRWPLGLAAAVLVVNVVALNATWLRLRSEADGLRAAMTRTYRAAFPKETVIVDPLAQMQQKIAASKRDAGQAAPDDFASLVARFGDAWSSAARGTDVASPPALAGLEYRDRKLTVKLKEPTAPLRQAMTTALATRGLALEEVAPDSWRIGNVK